MVDPQSSFHRVWAFFSKDGTMSIKAMTLVWEHSNQSGSSLLMLLAIADYAKDDGTGAWPAIETLARKTRMKRRNAIYVIQKLEKAGELRVHRDDPEHKSNIYDIVFPEEVSVQPSAPLFGEGVQPIAPEGATHCTGGVQPIAPSGVQPIAPDPLVEPSIEPSVNHQRSAPKNPTPKEVYDNPDVSERAKALLKKIEAELTANG
jgi:hypothetical protein